ncbi:MAG: hypothetical protein ACK5LN_00010 [Propioniciclava sp.]
MMIDIFSRNIVGQVVHACEDGILAKEMMFDAFGIHGTPQVMYSDGGLARSCRASSAAIPTGQ